MPYAYLVYSITTLMLQKFATDIYLEKYQLRNKNQTRISLLIMSFPVCKDGKEMFLLGAVGIQQLENSSFVMLEGLTARLVSITVFVNLEISSAIAFIGGQNTLGQKSTAIISDLILM